MNIEKFDTVKKAPISLIIKNRLRAAWTVVTSRRWLLMRFEMELDENGDIEGWGYDALGEQVDPRIALRATQHLLHTSRELDEAGEEIKDILKDL